jgi:hypothetical protein
MIDVVVSNCMTIYYKLKKKLFVPFPWSKIVQEQLMPSPNVQISKSQICRAPLKIRLPAYETGIKYLVPGN